MAGLVPSWGPINRFNDLFGGGWTTDLHYLVSLGKWKEETHRSRKEGGVSRFGEAMINLRVLVFFLTSEAAAVASAVTRGCRTGDDGLDK